MDKHHRRLVLSFLSLLSLTYGSTTFAAQAIDLSKQNIGALQSFIASPTHGAIKETASLKETNRATDFKQTLHVRVQETYMGYPVWGGDAVIHIPYGSQTGKSLANVLEAAKNKQGFMNGTLYQGLQADLSNTAPSIFTKDQAKAALRQAINTYREESGNQGKVNHEQSELMIYIDDHNKAHWIYKVGFYVEPVKEGIMPAKPIFIMDATSFKVYEQWNDIQTITDEQTAEDTLGGGYGGNEKMGKLVYDGLIEHLPKLNIKRDSETNTCFLQNADVTVKNSRGSKVMTFACEAADADHDNVFWDGEIDAVNGGYSPSNDALFGGAIIKDMYQKWYGVPVLIQNGKPMMLTMVVHARMDNAYWDGRQMTFGDGINMFYPLTSLGVAAHEISHGFTEQHSSLAYSSQSGGMNEAFSDIAAQGAEYFAYENNSWQIGPEIFKAKGKALRYMDQPSKDCNGKAPGTWCSIDHVSQYHDGLDVHYSSGIFNRAFYVLGTTSGWNTKKAFDVMVQANMHYWTSRSSFVMGACGVIKAAKDYNYNSDDVVAAFNVVGVDTSQC